MGKLGQLHILSVCLSVAVKLFHLNLFALKTLKFSCFLCIFSVNIHFVTVLGGTCSMMCHKLNSCILKKMNISSSQYNKKIIFPLMYIQPSNFIEFLQCIPDLVLIWRFSHPEISDSFCSLGF